jgi:peroxiredoxin Q/BCP
MNQLSIGDLCPIFELPDQNNTLIRINDLIGKKILVIFFYPKDNTPGCTKEACSFRDSHDIFLNEDCELIGISSDSPNSHQGFAQQHKLTYTLLSDSKKEVRKAFGVPSNLFGLIPGRVTYIIDLEGKVAGIYNSQSDPLGHIKESLKVVRSLKQRDL